MSYAPFLAAAFLLWPLTSMAGTQGNVLLLALAAIPALFVARPGIRPAHYLLAGMAFLVWAVASESWSPVSRGIISGTLMGGDFAIRSAGLRIILTLFFTTLLIAGALRTAPGRAQISSRLILGSLSIHGLLILLSPVFATSVMPVFYGDDPLNHSSGFQNLDRGANAFALVLPILVAYVGARPGLAWKGLALMIALASLVSFGVLGSSAAMFGAALMLVAFVIVRVFPKYGLRGLFTAVAAYIALAPILMSGLLYMLERSGVNLPGSFQSRAWSWEVVIGKIQEAPLMGHGIEASKSWQDTYAAYPEWMAQLPDFWARYPVVPGHPHNMALQIWAETGAVGAFVAALAVLLIGWRLPIGHNLRADIHYAIGGMLAAAFCLFSFSYSVWNEAFWSTLALAVVALIVLSRRVRGSLG
ncbi:O-antigen ligase family protein [uncultured Hyphomonas sp.]|uniref:O-antigen ligase family protein n=1 Tax=uncultured Hyphomonas sp. TaxID=225298 RepID=UPI00261E2105|nr:O-antigen ligase family protein [uncultured Hyphomonas sp.]